MQQAILPGSPESNTHWAQTLTQPEDQFQTSIQVLLNIAKEEAGADGYALYELDEGKGLLIRRFADGDWQDDIRTARKALLEEVHRQPTSAPDREEPQIASFPLRGHTGLAGVLEFAFRPGRTISASHHDTLQRTASAVAAILRRTRTTPLVVRLAARVAGLEAQLADLKIAERAGGLARHHSRAGRAEVLEAHVASVLETSEVEDALALQLKSLEQKLDERRVIGQAKAALQRTLSLTEEEAYLRLRETSRRTRTRLIDIARKVLDQPAGAA